MIKIKWLRYFSNKKYIANNIIIPIFQAKSNLVVSINHTYISSVKITIFIDDTSSKSSEHFGFLLYLINEGYYIQSILDTLFEMSQSYPDYSFFISKVIEEWSKKIKNDTEYKNEENKPIIGPSQFYNHLGK
jgi:hypothetical protein